MREDNKWNDRRERKRTSGRVTRASTRKRKQEMGRNETEGRK